MQKMNNRMNNWPRFDFKCHSVHFIFHCFQLYSYIALTHKRNCTFPDMVGDTAEIMQFSYEQANHTHIHCIGLHCIAKLENAMSKQVI